MTTKAMIIISIFLIFWGFWVKKEDYKTDDRIKQAIEKNGDNFRVIFFFDN